jgi:hypothetical protein
MKLGRSTLISFEPCCPWNADTPGSRAPTARIYSEHNSLWNGITRSTSKRAQFSRGQCSMGGFGPSAEWPSWPVPPYRPAFHGEHRPLASSELPFAATVRNSWIGCFRSFAVTRASGEVEPRADVPVTGIKPLGSTLLRYSMADRLMTGVGRKRNGGCGCRGR